MERRVPTKEEVLAYLKKDRNWGRWGDDDQKGAVNMVTAEKRAAAARLVRSGRAVSLSRVFPKTPAPNNLWPAQHYMMRRVRRLLRHRLPRPGLHPPGCAVSHVGRQRHLERPQPGRRDNL